MATTQSSAGKARPRRSKRAAFLEAYVECWNVSRAARKAHVSRQQQYEWLKDAEYEKAFDSGKSVPGAPRLEVMKKTGILLPALVGAFVLPGIVPAQPAKEDSHTMERNEHEYGNANPKAPQELSHFAFLIGKWRGEANLKREDGTWENLKALWAGRYILDGYAIADEFRMMTPAGELLVLGLNLRSYDAKRKAWSLKWLNALAGTWTDLGPEELGGVVADGKAISYRMKEPVARHAFTRATYTNISEDQFTWRGDRSDDGKAWEQFLVIELYRSEK